MLWSIVTMHLRHSPQMQSPFLRNFMALLAYQRPAAHKDAFGARILLSRP